MQRIIDRRMLSDNLIIFYNDESYNKKDFIQLIENYKSQITKNINTKAKSIIVKSDCSIHFLAVVFSCFELGILCYVAKREDVNNMASVSKSDFVIQFSDDLKDFDITTISLKKAKKENFIRPRYQYQNKINSEKSKLIGTLTCGVSGNQKVVIHTHESIFVSSRYMEANYISNNTDFFILDYFNILAYWTTVILPVLFGGGRLVFSKYNSIEKLSDDLSKNTCNSVAFFNFDLEKFIKNNIHYDFNKSITIFTYGTTLSGDVINKSFEKNCLKIIAVYGTTEVAAPVCVKEIDHISKLNYDEKNLGKLVKHTKAKIINGEIWLNGPNVCKITSEIVENFEDNWINTNDEGYMRNDLDLYIENFKKFNLQDHIGSELESTEIINFIKKLLNEDNINFAYIFDIRKNIILSIGGNKENISNKVSKEFINKKLIEYKNFRRGIDYIFFEAPTKGQTIAYNELRKKYKEYFLSKKGDL